MKQNTEKKEIVTLMLLGGLCAFAAWGIYFCLAAGYELYLKPDYGDGTEGICRSPTEIYENSWLTDCMQICGNIEKNKCDEMREAECEARGCTSKYITCEYVIERNCFEKCMGVPPQQNETLPPPPAQPEPKSEQLMCHIACSCSSTESAAQFAVPILDGKCIYPLEKLVALQCEFNETVVCASSLDGWPYVGTVEASGAASVFQ